MYVARSVPVRYTVDAGLGVIRPRGPGSLTRAQRGHLRRRLRELHQPANPWRHQQVGARGTTLVRLSEFRSTAMR